MAYKVKINGTEYSIKDGITIKEELNETLDSGIFQFELLSGEMNSTPFDDMFLYDDDETPKMNERHLLVDNIDDETYEFGATVLEDRHRYTISLFSQTKELERITLPNRTVTQPTDASGLTKKSVWYYIYHFCQAHLPKIRVYDEDQDEIKWVFKYKLDEALYTKFNDVDCPEFQWNNPTLREVLDDLMSVKDCIVIVRDNVISYYELNIKGNEINKNTLSLMKKTMNSSDYVSELSVYSQNAIGKNITKVLPYQALRTVDTSGVITTENCCITTNSPIYSIKKLVLYSFTSIYGTQLYLHKIDVTDRVLEQEEWNLLTNIVIPFVTYPTDLPTYTDQNGLTTLKHRAYFLNYKRGSNSINNLGTVYRTVINTVVNFTQDVFSETVKQKGTVIGTDSGKHRWYPENSVTKDPRYLFYELEYETVAQHAMNVGKYLPAKHPENRIFDAQENSYVDIEHQSIFEYAKVNRLGNKIIEIYGEYKSENDIPKLGDYIDNNILFSRELTFYDDIIYFKGHLTANYILRDYFTSVRAKKRSWQIASEKESMTTNNILKYYVETSFEHKEEIIDNISDTIQAHEEVGGLIHDLSNLKSDTSHTGELDTDAVVSQVIVRTTSANENASFTAIALDCDSEIQGYSLCYNFGFNDNFKSSDYTIISDDTFVRSFYEYADDYGEYSHFSVYLAYAIRKGFNLPIPKEDGNESYITSTEADSILEETRKKPKAFYPTNNQEVGMYPATKFDFYIHKDNREIERYSVQFEYCSDDENIVITPKYLEYVRFTNAETDKTFKVYISTTEKYALTTKTPLGEVWTAFADRIQFDKQNGYSMRLRITNANTVTNLKSIGIADQEGNLLIGINRRGDGDFTFNTIYFNLLKSRDDNVYFDVVDRKSIGHISDTLNTIRGNYNTYKNSLTRANVSRIRILNNRSVNTNNLIDLDE